jgi:hypothetical protein
MAKNNRSLATRPNEQMDIATRESRAALEQQFERSDMYSRKTSFSNTVPGATAHAAHGLFNPGAEREPGTQDSEAGVADRVARQQKAAKAGKPRDA